MPDPAYALEISNLTKTYGNGFEALKGISLNVEKGDMFALLGPNGAGKSTTIGILCSLVKKSSGNVKLLGFDIDTHFSSAKQGLGIVPQEINLNQYEKPFDILVNQAGYYGLKRNDALERTEYFLKALQLWGKHDAQTRFLSGGMKRRLMIARALVHKPELLILDEPTAGVDVESRRSMWELIKEINAQGTTIILTTHYLEEAEQLCRNIAIIDHGKIVKNTSVKALVAELTHETFVLDLGQPLKQAPALDNFSLTLRDSHTLELIVDEGQNLNDAFIQLEKFNIHVLSMRNKTNRLEELFVDLVKKKAGEH